jgi:bla regulator protein blaR1
MTPIWLTPIANHLWQSTVVAAVAAVLTLALRNNDARIRYWVWLIGSMKFLIPFSFLIALGGNIQWPHGASVNPRRLPVFVGQVTQPFALQPTHVGPSVRIVDSSDVLTFIPGFVALVWFIGFGAVLSVWFRRWQRIHLITRESAAGSGRPWKTLQRLQSGMRPDKQVRLLTSSERLEPGVVGIFRPVLLLPSGVGDQLTDSELEAVFTHELNHVRRRDNLTAALQTIVEALFWFHPLVWWIGNRLISEREKACDEAVLRSGKDPETYAEGILKVCEFYLKAPVACVSGVSGSNLRQRIEAIVARQVAHNLNAAKKLALAGAGLLAISLPVVIGMANAPQIRAQSNSATRLSFEVTSVKPNTSPDRRASSRFFPGGNFTATNNTLWGLILNAYWIPEYLVSGAPDWIKSEKFDIDAKAPADVIPPGSGDRARNDFIRRMIQTMLADRFKLAVHQETKEMPIYELVVSKNGPKLRKAAERDCSTIPCHMWGPGNPSMEGGFPGTSVDMDDVVDILTKFTDRPIVNKSNIQGLFDIRLQWNPQPGAQSAGQRNDVPGERIVNADPTSLPDLFTALDEQLGLKLESRKGQVQTIVIDHVERPSTN